MDSNQIMISLLFGLIGAGMFMFGKKSGRLVPLCSGLGLMVIPYMIPNPLILLVVCCAITAIPWMLRDG
jgi:hypothetical protein